MSRGRRRAGGRLRRAGWAAAVAGGACALYLLWLPDVSTLLLDNPKSTAYIRRYVERSLAKGKKPVVMMRWTRLYELSPHLRHAVVIAEDDMFYRHRGVDWESLREAVRYNWKKKRFARGASTITQQVARNLYLSPSRNPLRKLKEILIAYKLERVLTKDRILELYLNVAEWGVGIYGAQAASRIYFDKSAADLTVDEAVALAAALPSPWRWNPAKAGPVTAKRKEVLIARMRRAGFLSPEVTDEEVETQFEVQTSTRLP